jgi:pyruvate dehydrogenase E2 component (dihydrolipoamide acetyltransferase)
MVTWIRMPKYDWITTQPKIVTWIKKEGERVSKGEPLFVIETEKTTVEVESTTSGVLRKILVHEGEGAPVSSEVAIIADLEEKIPSVETLTETQARRARATMNEKTTKPKERTMNEKRRARISPRARRLAQRHKVDVTNVKGKGPGGRIVESDILEAMKTEPAMEVLGQTIPLTAERKAIAERMSYSAQTTAHITITTQIDMTEVVRFHDEFLAKTEEIGVKVTYTDIIVKATALALETSPILNSVLNEDRIQLVENINIGVAISTGDGLVVPVIHDANRKSLTEIASISKKLIENARKRSFSDKEVSGGTFTITNLGIFGVDIFTPIINPPQSAILGVGRILDEPTVLEGQVNIRPKMSLSLTFDHRVMDGVPAALFLQRLKEIMENPAFCKDS